MTTELLLERSAEQDAIDRTITEVVQGSGTTLIVEGVAGVGKTSLLKAAQVQAAEASMRVLHASASPLESGFAFGVATSLFGGPVRQDPGLLRGAAGFATHLFDPDAAPTGAGDDAAFATIHGLHWLVEGMAESGPLALIVDDVHWADEPSLRFLDYLARRLDGVPALAAMAARTGEPPDPPAALTRLVEEAPARLLRPAPLSRGGVSTLVAASLGPPEDAFVEACAETTGGNPFYLHACLAEATRQGLAPTATHAEDLLALRPEAIASALRARLDDLGKEHRALAEAVAVLGPGARLDDAAALADLDPAEAAPVADQLRAADVLTGTDRLAFTHAVVAAATVEAITPADLAERHRAAARRLADRGAPDAEVAAHLVEARPGAEEWAWRALGNAARRARRDGAPSAAMRLLRAALEERPPPAERGSLLRELALAEAMLGSGDDAVAHLADAVELGGTVQERARSCSDLGRILITRLAMPAAQRAFDLGIELARGEDDAMAREVEMFKVWGLIVDPDADLAQALTRGLDLASDPDAECSVAGRTMLGQLGTRLAFSGRLDDALRLAERAKSGEGAPDYSIYTATPAIVAAFTVAERPDLAEELAKGAEAEARRQGSLFELAVLSYLRAMARDRLGDVRGAAIAAEDAIGAVEYGYRYGTDLLSWGRCPLGS